MIIIFGLIRVLATTLFLYLVWRKLREDYDEENLLSYSWLFLLSFLATGRVTFGLLNWGVWNDSWIDWLAVWSKPGFNYIGAYFGALVFSWFYIRSKDWKAWNFAEDITPVALIYFIFMMLGEVIFARFGIEVLIWLAVLILTGIGGNVVKDKYRSMIWYVSGRKGFVFLFTNIIFSLMAFGVSAWQKSDWWVSLLFVLWSLISVAGLVMLGEVFTNLKVKKK